MLSVASAGRGRRECRAGRRLRGAGGVGWAGSWQLKKKRAGEAQKREGRATRRRACTQKWYARLGEGSGGIPSGGRPNQRANRRSV